MDSEEKIMSLLAMAEDQQGTVTQLIEASRQREQEQYQTVAALITSIADKHEALHGQYEASLRQQSTRLADRLDWTTLWLSSGVTFIVCTIIILAAYLYLGHIVTKTNVAETRYEELKRYDIKISSCTHEGEKYPCLRVRKSWGGYGDGTIFIIDTE